MFSREVTGLHSRGAKKILTLSNGREIVTTTVVVATGAKYRRLDVPTLKRFVGTSIFYTTFGEPRLVRDLDVAVAGGGNSAGQAALRLAAFARRVTLIVRANSLEKGMSDYFGAADPPHAQNRGKATAVRQLGEEIRLDRSVWIYVSAERCR